MELESEIVKEIGAYIIGEIVDEIRNNPVETKKKDLQLFEELYIDQKTE